MFTKKNLKNRMVVELRNGTKLMVVGKSVIGRNYSRDIDAYTDFLIDKYGCVDKDIVRVYAPIRFINLDYAKNIIYDRDLDESVVVEGMAYPTSCACCQAHEYSYDRCVLMSIATKYDDNINDIVSDYVNKNTKHPKCPVRKRITETGKS